MLRHRLSPLLIWRKPCPSRLTSSQRHARAKALRPHEWSWAASSSHPGKVQALAFPLPLRGVENTISLGLYPKVSLAQARRRHADARGLLARGIHPSAERRRLRSGLPTHLNPSTVLFEGPTSSRPQAHVTATTIEKIGGCWSGLSFLTSGSGPSEPSPRVSCWCF